MLCFVVLVPQSNLLLEGVTKNVKLGFLTIAPTATLTLSPSTLPAYMVALQRIQDTLTQLDLSGASGGGTLVIPANYPIVNIVGDLAITVQLAALIGCTLQFCLSHPIYD